MKTWKKNNLYLNILVSVLLSGCSSSFENEVKVLGYKPIETIKIRSYFKQKISNRAFDDSLRVEFDNSQIIQGCDSVLVRFSDASSYILKNDDLTNLKSIKILREDRIRPIVILCKNKSFFLQEKKDYFFISPEVLVISVNLESLKIRIVK